MKLTYYWNLCLIFCGVLMTMEVAAIPLQIAVRSMDSVKPVERASPIMLPSHIRRRRQESLEDYQVLHCVCDLDMMGHNGYVAYLRSPCVEAYNNRYSSQDGYQMYRTLQTEAFFFGQYYERLKRYEIDPHVYDYEVLN
ncbi:uncharacterized protein LOC108112490 [Drosophila eugracilis]|uniref:uncharacterized protein LOC108112490 n=1 Tax=Drosophila eugracilis TaxID=29029 RepID=UPI0007E5CD52|nr:uncharacterized protein LOC108112490 [Drosophila eugracilis]